MIAIEFGDFEQSELIEPLSSPSREDLLKALEWAEGKGLELPKLGKAWN